MQASRGSRKEREKGGGRREKREGDGEDGEVKRTEGRLRDLSVFSVLSAFSFVRP
jgi:hypothetical protein